MTEPAGVARGRELADGWLGHLRRDRRGLPVPYINLWGEQSTTNSTVRYDRYVHGDALFVADEGDTPNFLKQSPQRQRECMVAGLCQVCHRPVPWSRRNLVVSDVSVEVIKFQGRELEVVTEPWLDDRCAYIATALCPALIRRTREDRMALVRVTSQRDVVAVTSTGWIEGPLEEQTRANPVHMWTKLILTGSTVRVPVSALVVR